jgi:hypothetical protein
MSGNQGNQKLLTQINLIKVWQFLISILLKVYVDNLKLIKSLKFAKYNVSRSNRTWIFNAISHGPFFVFHGLMWEMVVCFVDFGRIVDHHCWNLRQCDLYALKYISIFFLFHWTHFHMILRNSTRKSNYCVLKSCKPILHRPKHINGNDFN